MKELVISIVDDDIVEPDETFFLNIVANSIITGFSPGRPNSDVIIGDYGRLMITILNDDGKYLSTYVILHANVLKCL